MAIFPSFLTTSTPPCKVQGFFFVFFFPTGSARAAAAFYIFGSSVFQSCVQRGHPVVSYPDICPAQIRKPGSRLFPPFTRRAAFSAARLTYTVKRLSQHWRSRLCVCEETGWREAAAARGGGIGKEMDLGSLSFIARVIYVQR